MASKLNSLTRWLRDYHVLARYKTQWILAGVFLLLAAAATLAVPLAFRGIVDTGLTSDAIDRQFIYLLLLATVLAVMTASRYYMMSWLGERVVADIRQRVFANVLRQSPTYFETLQTGEVLSRLTSDTTLVQTLVGSSISIALRSLVMLLGGMTMMLVTSAWLAGIMIVLLALIVLPLWALGRRVRKMSRTSQDKVADTSAMAKQVGIDSDALREAFDDGVVTKQVIADEAEFKAYGFQGVPAMLIGEKNFSPKSFVPVTGYTAVDELEKLIPNKSLTA
jgi:ATP-binding cassette subfamily B protein